MTTPVAPDDAGLGRAPNVRFTTDETSAQDILNAEFSLLNSTVSAALQEYRER